MKYFTKQWYELTNKTSYSSMLEVIVDESLSFKELYDYKLQKELRKEKRKHNKKPKLLDLSENLKDENFLLEDWVVFDETINDYVTPTNKQQVLDSIEKEYQRTLNEYNQRGTFDEDTFTDAFKETYKFALKNVHKIYPEWLLKEVDKRLLALDLIDSKSYEKLVAEEKKNNKEVNDTHNKAKKVLKKHALKLGERIANNFDLYDSAIISFKQRKNGNIVMKTVCGNEETQEEVYKTVTFVKAELVEYDETLRYGFNYYDYGKFSKCNFLFAELYSYKSYIEVHMMLENTDGAKYITLRCKDILVK